MHREQKLTSIIATHNTRLAAACDRVYRLEHGQLWPAEYTKAEDVSHPAPAG
jgi:ABC-type lipoprotein export system ATPase subunit